MKSKDATNQIEAVDIASKTNNTSEESRKELEINESNHIEIDVPNQLSADPIINQNKNIWEEENRILKEKLYVIDRERQDLRLILEPRELHED